jgi:hypothetical protein
LATLIEELAGNIIGTRFATPCELTAGCIMAATDGTYEVKEQLLFRGGIQWSISW